MPKEPHLKTWKKSKTFIKHDICCLCYLPHVISYLLGAYREHKCTGIIQNLMPFVDWEKSWMNLCLQRHLFIMMVDHKWVGLVPVFSSQLQSTDSSFAFRLFFKQESELSKVSLWWKIVRQVAMPVIYMYIYIYTEEIFRDLRTDLTIKSEKGLMGCRKGPTRYFDRLTRIPATWKIYKHCLPGLQKNWENFNEMLK